MAETAIVTGATGGIGQTVVETLTANGFHVVALGTRQEGLDALQKRTGCETLSLDICDPLAVASALDTVKADAVIHAAGVLGPQLPLYETPFATASKLVSVNILGTLNILAAVVPAMRGRGAGTVVLRGSICGTVPGTGPAVYSATKAAMHSMAANLRFDLRDTSIRVTEILLGRVRTGIHNQLESGDEFYDGYECLLPENVAQTVLHVLRSPPSVDLATIEMMPTRQVVGGSHFSKT